MLGSYFAWLDLACDGSQQHAAMFNMDDLPRIVRKQARLLNMAVEEYKPLFAKERIAYGDESDGEPEGVPITPCSR